MSRIETLTQDQINRMADYRDKWISIGLSTDPANRPAAEEGIKKAYRIAGLALPKIVWCGSPLAQGLTRALVMGLSKSEVRDSVWASVGASVRDSVWASGYGQHDANWLAFYEYFRDVCALGEQTQRLSGIWEISKNAGWWLPHEKICWVSERHNTLNRNSEGRLHCDNGPALQYPDGWAIWALNGVRVSENIVTTPAEKLDPAIILKEQNAEIRREIVRKIGIERVCERLNAQCVDKQGEYELLLLDLQDGRKRPYLKMRNPSIGVYHVEGVHPECTTVEAALKWRNGTADKPVVLT